MTGSIIYGALLGMLCYALGRYHGHGRGLSEGFTAGQNEMVEKMKERYLDKGATA